MVNQTDLIIPHFEDSQQDQIVDSYDLIKGIIVDFEGQANFKIKLDNSLPLIKGDPQFLTFLFKEFIRKAIELSSGLIGEIKLTHIKNPKSWIFAFFTIEFQNELQENPEIDLVETISEFTLAISKRSIHNQEDFIFSF